jgi:hypothetical protein
MSTTIGFAPLIRGEATPDPVGGSGGLSLAKSETPRSPSAHDPLVRGSNP